MHLLDLLMYFVCVALFWNTLAWISDGELTEEIGGLIGIFLVIILTIVYIWLFAWGPNDWNWIDIFNGTKTFNIKR